MKPPVLPLPTRLLLGLRVALSSAFLAWLPGVLGIAVWAFLAKPAAGRTSGQEAWSSAIYLGFYTGVVVLLCALLLVWPVCVFALRRREFPYWLGWLIGMICGGLAGVAMIAQLPWVLICAAYGAVMGGCAVWLGHRWHPLAPLSPPAVRPADRHPNPPL